MIQKMVQCNRNGRRHAFGCCLRFVTRRAVHSTSCHPVNDQKRKGESSYAARNAVKLNELSTASVLTRERIRVEFMHRLRTSSIVSRNQGGILNGLGFTKTPWFTSRRRCAIFFHKHYPSAEGFCVYRTLTGAWQLGEESLAIRG